MSTDFPAQQGLYDPAYEHDACGVAFVVDMHGRRNHRLVQLGLDALCHLAHRGATGAEENTGDGAGILMQVPDRFLRSVVDFALPPARHYAVGTAFLPADATARAAAKDAVAAIVAEEGLRIAGWRPVPTDGSTLGSMAREVMPVFEQLFLAGAPERRPPLSGLPLERQAFIVRKRIERSEGPAKLVYFPSLSARTMVYKGMLTSAQLADFYPDLHDDRVESALALVHSRFSTNT
ncbi:MAG: glutamate synthase subunit alpha, partial [Acidimicrobiales bacterium]